MFWNKLFGALLATGLAIFGIREFTHVLVHPHQPETPGYAVAVDDGNSASGETQAVVKEVSLAELLASADASKGERVSKKCQACHTFEQGGANKVGPNLWNIVDRPSAGVDGFKYSDAMHNAGWEWTYEELNHFLKDPKAAVPGTAMSFAGLPKAGDRANLLAYLQTMSDNPVPFPAVPTPAPAEVEGADAAAQPAEAPAEEPAAEPAGH